MGPIDNTFKGKVAEKAFELEYLNYGLLPIKITIFDNTCFERGLKYNMILNEKDILEGIEKIFTVSNKMEIAEKIINDFKEIRSQGFFLPDYILLEAPNKILIYEIKNSSKKYDLISTKKQREGIKRLKEKGYKVYVKAKNINLDTKNPFHKEIINNLLNERCGNLQNELTRQKEKGCLLEKQIEELKNKLEEKKNKKSFFLKFYKKFKGN